MKANFVRKLQLSPQFGRFVLNFYRPLRGAGIRVASISDNYDTIRVVMPLRWYNSNYVGSHFGGSIYAMTDPFYMMMLIHILGSGYIVWDKAAKINFIKPGRSTLSAEFHFRPEEIEEIKAKANENGKYVFDKPVQIYDDRQVLIAEVVKTLYVRVKTQRTTPNT